MLTGNLRLLTFISITPAFSSSSIQGPRLGIGMMAAVYIRRTPL